MFWRKHKKEIRPTPATKALSVAPNALIYAVGDIHGRADLLKALLAKIEADAKAAETSREPRLIFLGDYIDRGDQSKQVIEMLSGLDVPYCRKIDFLMGNHEAALLAFLDNPTAGKDWLNWGGRQTLASYGIAPPSANPTSQELSRLQQGFAVAVRDHMDFFRKLERLTQSGSVIFAHAALDPTCSIDEQPDAALLWGEISEKAESGLPGYRLVHGHFASPTPLSTPNRICTDTGAYFSGILTAVRLSETEEFINTTIEDL